MDVFVSVLKESYAPVTVTTLQELSLVTSIVSQCRAGQRTKQRMVVFDGSHKIGTFRPKTFLPLSSVEKIKTREVVSTVNNKNVRIYTDELFSNLTCLHDRLSPNLPPMQDVEYE